MATDTHCALLFSVDINGFTALKQMTPKLPDGSVLSVRDSVPWWSRAISDFYRDVRDAVVSAFEEQPMLAGVAPPTIFKVMGDEVILRADPRTAEEAAAMVLAYFRGVDRAAVHLMHSRPWREPAAGLPSPPVLSLQGTAWLVNLPHSNTEVRVPIQDVEFTDILGPGLEFGFTLGSLASPGWFALGPDLGWCVLDAATRGRFDPGMPATLMQLREGPVSGTTRPVLCIGQGVDCSFRFANADSVRNARDELDHYLRQSEQAGSWLKHPVFPGVV